MPPRPASRQGKRSVTAWLDPDTMRGFNIFCARYGMSKERALELVVRNTITTDGHTRPWVMDLNASKSERPIIDGN